MDRPDSSCSCHDEVIWREKHSEHWGSFDDTIFVTDMGLIGINVGGSVYVMPLKKWHELAGGPIKGLKQ
jgi:hypothetical protein